MAISLKWKVMFNTEELLQVQIDWFYRTLVNDSGSNTFIFEAARNVHMVTPRVSILVQSAITCVILVVPTMSERLAKASATLSLKLNHCLNICLYRSCMLQHCQKRL